MANKGEKGTRRDRGGQYEVLGFVFVTEKFLDRNIEMSEKVISVVLTIINNAELWE